MNRHTVVRIGMAACLVGVLSVTGCRSTSAGKNDTYGMQTDLDADFASGLGRAPTPRTLYTMATIFASQGRDAECYFVLTRLMDTYPQFAPAYNAMAEWHLRRGQTSAALELLNRGLEISPNDAVFVNNLGMCALMTGDYDLALSQFRVANELQPQSASYRANLALALGMLGQYDESLRIYKQIVSEGEAHYNVAICCRARQDEARAMQEMKLAEAKGFKEDSP